MPDYAERSQFEKRIEKSLSPIFKRAAKEGGDLATLQADIDGALRPDLLRLFIVIYLFMLNDDSISTIGRLAAESFATSASSRIAAGVVAQSQASLAGGAAPAAVFTPSRVGSIAATEVTRTISAGETAARREVAGDESSGDSLRADPLAIADSTIAIWWTEKNAANPPCKICRPLHRKPYDSWGSMFPNGPPAHQNCRCWIIYEPLKESLSTRFSAAFVESCRRWAEYLSLIRRL